MNDKLEKLMREAKSHAQLAANRVHDAESWFHPDADEERSPRAMMRKLLNDAEAEAELALQFIRNAQDAL